MLAICRLSVTRVPATEFLQEYMMALPILMNDGPSHQTQVAKNALADLAAYRSTASSKVKNVGAFMSRLQIAAPGRRAARFLVNCGRRGRARGVENPEIVMNCFRFKLAHILPRVLRNLVFVILAIGERHASQFGSRFNLRANSVRRFGRLESSSRRGSDDRLQRLAGLGRLAGRHRQGLAQGGRHRCDISVVRLFGVDGRLFRRQNRRRSW